MQIAHKVGGQLTRLEHLGSAHNPKELETLISLAKERLRGNQMFLFFHQEAKLQIKLKQSYSHLLFQVLNGQYQISEKLKVNKINGLLVTEKTPTELIEERNFTEIHEILYWLNKNDPRGNPPSDSGSDPQYKNWEDSLQIWLKNNYANIYNQLPKDYDN